MGGIKGRGAAKERRREASKVAATGGGVARGGDRHGGVVEEGQQGPGAIAGQRSATLACLRTTALRRFLCDRLGLERTGLALIGCSTPDNCCEIFVDSTWASYRCFSPGKT
uniref:Uncharacterized protein n=1 Tax=Mus musculus TaxID=10090 RepID=Q9D9U5_MOUSE|nr:unnamed protein product [Mus musculus]